MGLPLTLGLRVKPNMSTDAEYLQAGSGVVTAVGGHLEHGSGAGYLTALAPWCTGRPSFGVYAGSFLYFFFIVFPFVFVV